jgi:hypothetical protein
MLRPVLSVVRTTSVRLYGTTAPYRPSYDFTGQRAVVTGGTKGSGSGNGRGSTISYSGEGSARALSICTACPHVSVTGAGIGRAVSYALADLGAKVVALGRTGLEDLKVGNGSTTSSLGRREELTVGAMVCSTRTSLPSSAT